MSRFRSPDLCPTKELVAPERIPEGYRGAKHTEEFDEDDRAIGRAYDRLTQAVEQGASPKRIEALQADLDRARAEAAEAERRETELASIRSAVKRKQAADAMAAKVTAGTEAAAQARSASAYAIELRGAGLTVTARPSTVHDPAIRLTVVTSMQTAAVVLQRYAEDAIHSARLSAMGSDPKAQPSQEWLMTQLADVLRVGIRHGAISIAANRD